MLIHLYQLLCKQIHQLLSYLFDEFVEPLSDVCDEGVKLLEELLDVLGVLQLAPLHQVQARLTNLKIRIS